jgi:transglutaminase superfamily protein
MSAIRKFLRLHARDRRLLLEAVTLLLSLRVALRLIPIRWLFSIRFHRTSPATIERTDRLLWSVCCASRRLPATTCLVQALALHILMSRYGHDSQVRIGVTNRNGNLDAHAWVESGGQVLLGGPDVTLYRPLFSSQAESS